MPKLAIATTATSTPMGAQAYQAAITDRAEHALAEHSTEPWTVRSLVARSLRSDLPGNRRLPMGRLFTASERERRLLGRGHAVEVWTVDRGDGLRDEVVDGCRVRYLPTPLPARSARALGSLALRAPQALIRWVRAYAVFRPDVINVQCFGPNGVYGLALAKLTGTALLVSSHGETFMDEHGIYDRSALLRAALRRAIRSGTVTACSNYVADDLRSRFGARDVSVIPNGVHLTPAHEAPLRGSPKRDSRRPLLLGAGRLVPQKGFDVLLRAAARSRSEPQVWIVGDGAERGRLEELAASLSISQRVQFLGRRTASEVQSLMATADAVVVPSRVEPFGIVVLEAWAAGTPVLATNRGGPAGFVTDGHDGLLIDPEDLSSVVTGIDRATSEPVLASRLAHAGRETVQSFTWPRVVDDYQRAYSFASATPQAVTRPHDSS